MRGKAIVSRMWPRPHSQATVVLDFVGSAVVADNIEIIVGDGAHLTIVSLQDWARDAVHHSTQHARVDRDAVLRHSTVSFGGDVVRLGQGRRDLAALGIRHLIGLHAHGVLADGDHLGGRLRDDRQHRVRRQGLVDRRLHAERVGPDRSKRHSGYYETGYSEERYAGTYTDDLYDDGSGTASGIGNKVRTSATAAGSQLSRSKEALREGVNKTSKTVKDTVSSTRSAVKDSLNRTTVAAQTKAVQAKEQFNVMLEEQPLLLGFLGVAVGAAIGFMLPHTEQEDQLVGEVRDKAIAKAKDFGAQSYEQARNIAEQKIGGTVQANAGNSEPGHSHGHV